MKLTTEERSRILAGERVRLVREGDRPKVKRGQTICVQRGRPPAHEDPETGQRIRPDLEPIVWITIRDVKPKGDGWLVRYDITDNRDGALFLAKGAGYTTDVSAAVDNREAALSLSDRRLIAIEARTRAAEQRKEDEMDTAKQRRKLNEELRTTLPTLDLIAQQELLAALQREIRKAKAASVQIRKAA